MKKDFPLNMQLSAFNKLTVDEKIKIREEIFKKLNDVHGPVIQDYAEIIKDKDIIIIHNIVDIREKCNTKCAECKYNGESCDV